MSDGRSRWQGRTDRGYNRMRHAPAGVLPCCASSAVRTGSATASRGAKRSRSELRPFSERVSRSRTCSHRRKPAPRAQALRDREERHRDLSARRRAHARHVGPEAERAGRNSRRVQADSDERDRHSDLRTHAANSEVDAHKLAILRSVNHKAGLPQHAPELHRQRATGGRQRTDPARHVSARYGRGVLAEVAWPPAIGQPDFAVYIEETGHTLGDVPRLLARHRRRRHVRPPHLGAVRRAGLLLPGLRARGAAIPPRAVWTVEPFVRPMPIGRLLIGERSQRIGGPRRRQAPGRRQPLSGALRPLAPETGGRSGDRRRRHLRQVTGHTISGAFLDWYRATRGITTSARRSPKWSSRTGCPRNGSMAGC